jgi:Zn-dependent protease with chaperone function
VALVATVIGILYGLLIGFFIFVAQAMLIAYIRGDAVKLSPDQLPHLHQRVVEAAGKLEMKKVPEAYVLQAGGALNAFATKFIGRNFIVLFSDLVDACDPEGKEIDAIIGHELGHLALGHLRWLTVLAPARFLPWLGAAYSRACEYSCDRCGMEVAGDLHSACRGLSVLAAGGKLSRQVNLNASIAQAQETGGFWTSIYELNASHPFLPKRIAALVNWKRPGSIPIPGRNILAYPLAPFFGFGAVGGGAAAPRVIVAMIGIMAALAIPQFQQYREKAKHASAMQSMDQILHDCQAQAVTYTKQYGTWPCTVEDLGHSNLASLADSNGWEVQVDCQNKYVALYYPEKDQTHYRAVMFETGEIEAGVLED